MARSYTTVALCRASIALLAYLLQPSYCSDIIPITANTFHSFVSTSNVRLIHVSYAAATSQIESFIVHYSKAAKQLQTYGILLGQVICDEFSKFEYCKRERTERFLFGFRGTKERLVLPISTLADENAIVASALHLALIHSVPIIQTSSELHKLQQKCVGRCNIILAYHNTLGTLEHKLFLQLAWAYQKQHVFALTTSIDASPAASLLVSQVEAPAPAKQLVAVWLLQCKQAACQASLLRNNFSYNHINTFTKALQLPTWLSVDERFPSTYSRFGIHQIILVFDAFSKARVMALAEPLGLAFRGNAGVVVTSQENLHLSPLNGRHIVPPTLAFLPTAANTASILNGLENAYDFILEQLKFEELSAISEENYEISSTSYLPAEETAAQEIWSGANAENTCMQQIQYKLIIYYMDWDVVCQVMLKMLSSLELSHIGVDTSQSVNCFTHAQLCDKVQVYPTLEIIGHNKSQRFGAMSQQRLLAEIFAFIGPDVTTIWSRHQLEAELRSPKYKYVSQVAILATDAIINEATRVSGIIRQLPRQLLLLLAVNEAATYIGEECSCPALPCLALRTLEDSSYTYHGSLDNVTQVTHFLQHTAVPLFPQLTPQLLPTIRNKLLILSLGMLPTIALKNAASKINNTSVFFTWVSRHDEWFDELRLVHAPDAESALVGIYLTSACSYTYPHDLYDETAIQVWIQRILNSSITPSGYLDAHAWKPLQPALDYLQIVHEQRRKREQSIITDTDDPFISTEALSFTETII